MLSQSMCLIYLFLVESCSHELWLNLFGKFCYSRLRGNSYETMRVVYENIVRELAVLPLTSTTKLWVYVLDLGLLFLKEAFPSFFLDVKLSNNFYRHYWSGKECQIRTGKNPPGDFSCPLRFRATVSHKNIPATLNSEETCVPDVLAVGL